MALKIVVEITESAGDESVLESLREINGARHAPYLFGAGTTLDVEIVGVVTAEDSPGDQLIMAVEPL